MPRKIKKRTLRRIKYNLKQSLKNILLGKFFTIVMVFLLSFFLFYINWYDERFREGYGERDYFDQYKALKWLKENSPDDSVILAEWTHGPIINRIADRKTIASSKVYPSETKMVSERYKDISTFFFSTNEKESLNIINKYNISYIFINKYFSYYICSYINFCNITNKRGRILPEFSNKILIKKFLNKSIFTSYILVYESKDYLIYEVELNRNE